MRICLVYDCLFPHTVGGAERWYRNLALRLVAQGHDVTYITLRQWDRGESPDLPGVRVVTAGPRMKLYSGPGQRRVLPPIVFGFGVLWHLLLRGRRYDVVHTASFPYFSLLAAAVARPLARFRLVVDWHELWSREYWREYLGGVGGRIGWAVQKLCLRIPQRSFCFAQMTAKRLRDEGLNGEVSVYGGSYGGPLSAPPPLPAEPVVVFAGRHIPEKQAPAAARGIAEARRRIPQLRGVIFGSGPERDAVLAAIEAEGQADAIRAPGFVETEELETTMARALCLLHPSKREGYGLIVVESSSHGVPTIVVPWPDNAAVELVEDGVNGVVAASASPSDLADAIERVWEAGGAMRTSTAEWFERNAKRVSADTALDDVVAVYSANASI